MWIQMNPVGPTLGEKSFPVHRVVEKTASRSVGIFFFFLIFFYKLECTGRGSKKKKKKN